jgi:hypothetical protein
MKYVIYADDGFVAVFGKEAEANVAMSALRIRFPDVAYSMQPESILLIQKATILGEYC